jgi:hypothetical protein
MKVVIDDVLYAPVSSDPHVKERVIRLVDALQEAFTWASSEDGFDYWEDVQERLARIAREGR